MSKLSDKIRIVSSDGEVLDEAKGSEPDIKEVKKSPKKGLFGKKNDSVKSDKESVVDRVKGMLGKDRKEVDEDPIELDVPDSKRPRVGNVKKSRDKSTGGQGQNRLSTGGQSTGGQNTGGDPFEDFEVEEEEEKKSETPLFIGIIVALAIVGIAFFIYALNSSKMAAIDVEPQKIDEPAIEQVLEGDHENFTILVKNIKEVEASNSEEDSEIKIDTPQEKEELEDRVLELEGIIEVLKGENEELTRKLNSQEVGDGQ